MEGGGVGKTSQTQLGLFFPSEAPLLPLSMAPWCRGAAEVGSEAWLCHCPASQAVIPKHSSRELWDNLSGAMLPSLYLQHPQTSDPMEPLGVTAHTHELGTC